MTPPMPPTPPQSPTPDASAPSTPDAAVAVRPDAARPFDAARDTPPDRAPPLDLPPPPADAAMPVVRRDAPSAPPGSWWKPSVGATWDWQLRSPIDPSFDVSIYDIDLFDNSSDVVRDLQARGRRVICYVNLGAWEDWRPDAGRFPAAIIGQPYRGFPDENWLDIRAVNYDVLLPIIRDRLDMAVDKGCDAVEPDNMNGYDTETHEPSGFPLTYEDQILYNRLVAEEAHRRGLGIGLKNDLRQVRDLVNDFDFAVNEQCFQYNECEYLRPFIEAGKPVFQAEYSLQLADFCAQSRVEKFSSIKKTDPLDATRQLCP
jgi:hypothetical protein